MSRPARTLAPTLSRAALAALLVAGICACARLPVRPATPPEASLPVASDGALDLRLQPLTDARPGQSGFLLVSDGTLAFDLRAALARQARRSLDLQYYIWHSDLTGRLLAREVLAAADRGVRVRILLDDLDARSRGFWLAAADAHPNLAVRLFNPFAARRGPMRKLAEAVGSFHRINHRMHNKAWIVDGRVAIAGGRNLGDEYFAASTETNFEDLDLAMAGPVVADLGRAFDAYWNAADAWPVTALHPDAGDPETLAELRTTLEREAARAASQRWLETVPRNPAVAAFVAGETPLHWSERWRVLADDPGKARLPEGALQRSNVLHGLLEAMRLGRSSIFLVSPYFVPGEQGTRALVDLAGHGRTVSVLTNSLAANDVAAVYAGYARYRTPLLRAGLSLYELKPEPQRAGKPSLTGSGGASLHTKAAVIDGDVSFVGSFNLDPRSAVLNNELGVLVTDPGLGRELDAYAHRLSTPAHAWRVDLDPQGRVRWTDDSGSTTKTPASLGRRIRASIARMLPIESQL